MRWFDSTTFEKAGWRSNPSTNAVKSLKVRAAPFNVIVKSLKFSATDPIEIRGGKALSKSPRNRVHEKARFSSNWLAKDASRSKTPVCLSESSSPIFLESATNCCADLCTRSVATSYRRASSVRSRLAHQAQTARPAAATASTDRPHCPRRTRWSQEDVNGR